jgi:hypothetical protein
MQLSEANAIQAKTGNVAGQTISVTLDNPTTPGGTVIVEMFGPAFYPDMPDGWEFDCFAAPSAAWVWYFRYCGGPGGEISWDWTYITSTTWLWRVTEWDTRLDPVGPFETYAANGITSGSVPTFSTGTTPQTNRAEVVCLATHVAVHNAANPGMTLDFSGHTNGFVERDQARASLLNAEYDACWSWAFAQATGTFECTATVNNSDPAAGDSYYGLLGVYAAAVPVEQRRGGNITSG